jgi:hypothetical protein
VSSAASSHAAAAEDATMMPSAGLLGSPAISTATVRRYRPGAAQATDAAATSVGSSDSVATSEMAQHRETNHGRLVELHELLPSTAHRSHSSSSTLSPRHWPALQVSYCPQRRNAP